MILSMSAQARLFLWTVSAGFSCAFVYDAIRILRRFIPHGGFLAQVEDAAFWAALTAAVFYLALIGGNGAIRFYVPLGAFLGIALYFSALSPHIIKAAGAAARRFTRKT
jgi:spore cortex biosynthesis protein YabQ